MIPLSIPNLGPGETARVKAALESGWVSTAGPDIAEFERKVGQYCGLPFALATQSGTSALHLAFLALGVGHGHLVLMPNLTFVASLNALRYVGAEPVFMDISPKDWQMDLDLVEGFLLRECAQEGETVVHKASGKQVRAVLAVHALGRIGDMERLSSLCHQWGLDLVEDAAAALGATRTGRHAGSWGRAAILSFNGNKVLTTGGGGMLLTRDPEIYARAAHLANQARSHSQEYLHDQVGYNYKMTNLAAALGLAQMERLPQFLDRKKAIFERYRTELGGWDEVGAWEAPLSEEGPGYWLSTFLFREARVLEECLEAGGIQARKLWVPLNRLPMGSGFIHVGPEDHALRVYEASLALPCSTHLGEEEQGRVIAAIKRYYGR